VTPEAQKVWQEIGRPENAQPTPEQLLQFMQLCDDADGLALAERMLQSSDDAHRCWLMGHDSLQDEVTWMRRKLTEAEGAVVRALQLAQQWEINAQSSSDVLTGAVVLVAAGQIRAALETRKAEGEQPKERPPR
jgi:hypothetical protein